MSDEPDPPIPVRTDYLLDEIRDVRAEVRSVRSDLQGEIRELCAETRTEIGSLHAKVDAEIGSLREELRNGLNRMTAVTSVLFTTLAVLVTVVQFALR